MTNIERRARTLAGVVCLGGALASCAAPTPPDRRAGTWVMSANQRPIVLLQVGQERGKWSGSLSMPEHLQVSSDGMIFSAVGPRTKTKPITTISAQSAQLHLVIENPQDKSDTDELDLTLLDDNHASLAMAGAPMKPWRLTRSADTETIASDWNPEQSYLLDTASVPSNVQMRAIFDADQKARQGVMQSSAKDWSALIPQDAQRRVATLKLLNEGQLHTGQDFRQAAFVFQHGEQADDYLFAHTLALVALAKGDVEARWIAAASLDRYLHAIGKAEIYGLGFEVKNGRVTHEEPFNTALITDDLRRALGILPVAEQLDQYKALVSGLSKK